MSNFEKFFASKNVMFVSFFIAIVMLGIVVASSAASITYLPASVFYLMSHGLIFCVLIGLYRSYAKHETNALNNLTGALIGLYIMLLLFVLYDAIVVYSISQLTEIITSTIMLVLIVILFVNHIQINSAHKSTRGRIVLNQVILIILGAYQVLMLVLFIIIVVVLQINSPAYVIASVCGIIARIFVFFMIICVESRLNAYKLERESSLAEGTWTEEKKAETKEKYFNED